jgi:hypothetical protein
VPQKAIISGLKGVFVSKEAFWPEQKPNRLVEMLKGMKKLFRNVIKSVMESTQSKSTSLPNSRGSFIILISLFFVTNLGFSQTWSSVGGGMTDWVYASTIYNGDLIVGGKFTNAGGVSANHIARWNGTAWEPLGDGVNGKVNSLIVYNGNLVAAGEFTIAGGLEVNFIAMWDGVSWSDELGGVGSTVTSLAVIADDLYAGGYFTEADNTPVNYIARRDTAGWVSVGGGMGGTQGQVMTLLVYNNELYAGGFFTTAGGVSANHIAKWNGTSWSALGSGISGIVYTLGEYNGNLIAGGLFLSAGTVAANHIASWNGTSWSALGAGMGGVFYQYVFALTVYNGNLIAGGYFTESDGLPTNGIAKWNGTSWSGMGGGFFYPANVYGAHTFCQYGTDLIVGGLFSKAGAVNASHIAAWNETSVTTRTINLHAYLESLYNPATGQMNHTTNFDVVGNPVQAFPGTTVDTMSVWLMQATPPWNPVYKATGQSIDQDGMLTVSVPGAFADSYYLAIKHRTSIETWSSSPVSLAVNPVDYDFTFDGTQAYGNNLVQTATGVFAIYGGDINQDGVVDALDLINLDNDASAFTTGYLPTDINGDGTVDVLDMLLADNNSAAFISSNHP